MAQHQVRNRSGRVIFEGNEKDARTYVENNFPRMHAEPGAGVDPSPDVEFFDPDGVVSHYHGPETGWVDPTAEKPDAEMPAASANREAWVAYAEAQGDEDASMRTKKDLVAHYTTQDEGSDNE
jgi:hypothetical protein